MIVGTASSPAEYKVSRRNGVRNGYVIEGHTGWVLINAEITHISDIRDQ